MMMGPPTGSLDLTHLRLTSGEGRRVTCDVDLDGFELGGERYETEPVAGTDDGTGSAAAAVSVRLDISRTTGEGYALRLRFRARLHGPCMRCLTEATPEFEIDAREVSQPGGGDELESPYVSDGLLDVSGWAHDALALSLPAQILCRPGCAGLCSVCGADLRDAGPDHHHESGPDPRWAKLSELRFD